MKTRFLETVAAAFVCLATTHAQSFIYSESQSLFVTPHATIPGYPSSTFLISLDTTLAGQVEIDPLSGLVSVSGTLNALFGTVSQQTSLISQVTFHPNQFPTPGGFNTTNTIGVVLQASLGNFPVSQVVSASGVTPIYISPNYFRIPISTSLSGAVDFTVSDYGSMEPGNTAQVNLNLPLNLFLDIANYPSSVTVTSFLAGSTQDTVSVLTPAGTQVYISAVPEPREFAMVSVFACIALFWATRRWRMA